MVGIVMVISLLSVPQMTAAIFVRTYNAQLWLSALFAFMGCVAGLFLSFYADVPGGASVILASICIYLLCRTIKYALASLYPKLRGIHRREDLC